MIGSTSGGVRGWRFSTRVSNFATRHTLKVELLLLHDQYCYIYWSVAAQYLCIVRVRNAGVFRKVCSSEHLVVARRG